MVGLNSLQPHPSIAVDELEWYPWNNYRPGFRPEQVCRKKQRADLFIADAKGRGFHPVRGDMFIARRPREPRARFGGAELNLTSNQSRFIPPLRTVHDTS